MQILNAACKMYDILEENVTLVENIEKSRQPYPTLEAIYFLTPCRDSILRLIDDFTAHKTPMYKAAHVHFTSGLDDELFSDLNRRLKSTGASQSVLSLKEMYVDFMAIESSVFTVDPETAFLATFGTSPQEDKDAALRTMAKQPPRHPPEPRATFLIVDRTLDPIAPLLHEFTYQAMINDLLPVEVTENRTGIKYTYEFTQADESLGTKEVVLDEDDNVFQSIRHLHIADCTDRLIEEFNAFLDENKAAAQSGNRAAGPPKDSAKSLKDMKDMLSNLPQFQEMKAKYSAHLSIAQECMSVFERHKLNSVGNLEQNMATGETPTGETPKTIVLDMVPLLDDPYVSDVDKTRLLMLYIISKEGCLFEDDKYKLIEHAKLQGPFREAIDNLSLLGISISRPRNGERSTKKKKDRKRTPKGEDMPFELSRFVPTLKKVMDNQLSNNLDSKQFAYTRQSDMESVEDTSSSSIPASGISLRTTKPTWNVKGGNATNQSRTSSGAKLIVFVLGGATYSEIRSVYEVAQMHNRQVYIGTTEILRPQKYVEKLSKLRQPLEPIRPTVSPYVPPSPVKAEPKTSSIMSHMPHITQSTSHLSLSGSSIKSTGSGAYTPGEDKQEKKKKRGLKKYHFPKLNLNTARATECPANEGSWLISLVMEHHKHNRSHKRQRYIPEEVYDVDGTLIKNEAAFKPKTWNLKEILSDPGKRVKAYKEAQVYIKSQRDRPRFESSESPWSQMTDDLFFSRRKRGLASWFIPSGSPIYYEFEESIQDRESQHKVQMSDRSTGTNIQQEGEMIRHAIILFQDFTQKKKAALKEKIEKSREALPITPFANAIVHTLKEHRVLLIAGDTGCGKSTQVPQILMKAGFQKIACTQPRRIACSSLARRVSYETMNEYGSEIAYQVRFEGTKTKRTRILFLTEGLLLRQYSSDNTLSMYDVIVVDEVHERHMMGDFLLALLKHLLKIRTDLYVVLMSATINAELFAQYFDAPALIVPGKMYDVKVHYWPQGDDDKNLTNNAAYLKRRAALVKESIPSRSERVNPAPYINVMEYITQSVPITERGDLLIFMSGINEISSLAEELKQYAYHTKKWVVLILHSSVAVEEQEKVFDMPPEGVRKCIISTNIAETSVTIDGIRFIVDSGKVKELTHDATSNMSKLSEFWISKASATQRSGRAGRTGPGECFRLYSENEYNHFNDFAVPEIQRVPLEPLLLQIKAMELEDPRTFDYVESPSPEAINASMDFLQNLGAIDVSENIRPLGAVLANLPVDAIIGKMLVMATVLDVVDPVLTIASAMSVQSPFTRLTANTSTDMLQNRRTFDSHHGDPFTLLNLWQAWLQAKGDRKHSSRSWCRRHGVEEHRLYEIAKMRRQFEKMLNDFQPGLLESLKPDTGSSEEQEEEVRSKMEKREMLRRERYGQRSRKKRRVLEMEYEGQEDWKIENDNEATDIRDLEFTVTNNIKSLQSRATALSDCDIHLIKICLCSALYPQLAIGDEHNPYRKSNEIVFHTPVKNFLSPHPTSVIASHPDWVQGLGDNVRKDDLQVEQSMYHQLLCYLQLLETNKPYILNVTRVPGIHILLLFAKTIDTNSDCSVLVLDGYYVVKFRTVPVAEYVLYLSYMLRTTWNRLLTLRISQGTAKSSEAPPENYIITSSVREHLPVFLQNILADQEKDLENPTVDLWTPAVEAGYREEIMSLKRKILVRGPSSYAKK
ncbi:DEAH (Asp-Glu-Ala-His) box polypeptide 34 [Apophysomyces ossiformis]|uniref:DEAH (Asp-Glu-Ala-His) box polypeptide 34 n=1 Tax=Apophysomyces ossiformis TaxID=679940 RepID=A0A8H7ENZ5_9FUNG|nr:DEAH (Asp-Glu-Ala-His) box polypeptide 34 [Apophysomyces ossiformis]